MIVQSGNTIPAIATANGVSLQDMLDANLHIVNSDLIFPGDVVFVPPCDQTPGSVAASAVKPARASCVPKKYTAKEGDKPGTIAATFNMQIGDLLRLNPRLRKFRTRLIKAGQLLDVLSCPKAVRPSFPSAQVCKSFYTVTADDTATSASCASCRDAGQDALRQNGWCALDPLDVHISAPCAAACPHSTTTPEHLCSSPPPPPAARPAPRMLPQCCHVFPNAAPPGSARVPLCDRQTT